MADEALEPIKLRVTSPKAKLQGIDDAVAKLTELKLRITEVKALLKNPIAANFGIKDADTAGRIRKGKTGSLNAKDLAKEFGFDFNEFDRFVSQEQKKIISRIQRSKTAINRSTGDFTSARAADRAISMFSQDQAGRSLGRFMVGGSGGGKGGAANISGPVDLTVSPAQIRAILGPGLVELIVPPGQVRGASVMGGAPTGGGASGGGATFIGGGSVTPSAAPGRGVEISRKESHFQGREVGRETTEVLSTGRKVQRFFEETEEGLAENGRTTVTDSAQVRGRHGFQRQVQEIRQNLDRGLATANPAAAAKLTIDSVKEFEKLLGNDRGGLASLLGDDVVGRVEAQAESLKTKAIKAERSFSRTVSRETFEGDLGKINARFTKAVKDTPESLIGALRKQRDEINSLVGKDGGAALRESGVSGSRVRAAQKIGVRSDAQALAETGRAVKAADQADFARRRELGASSAKADNIEQKRLERVATEERRVEDRRRQRASVSDDLRREVEAGGRIRSKTLLREGGKVVGHRLTTTRETAKGSVTSTFDTQKGRSSMKELIRLQDAAGKSTQRFGSNILDNTARVTGWAAGVAVLYGTLGLARTSLESLIRTGSQMNRLDQVFRQVGGSTKSLLDDVMGLAAAEGQAADSAIESAIAWSRLGLTRMQVNEAVRTSLMAANVAEMTPAEATENLAAVMQAFKLEIGDLAGVLGQLNEVSNTYRVTNRDLLEGIARSGSVAKQAGLGLSELIGVIGSGVGATGQSGSNIGNSIKTLLTKLGNPKLQERLSEEFNLDLTTDSGDLQDMSSALAELYVRYQELNDAQQASLRFQVAGAFQSSRLAALLDNYVKAQTLAINAQLNLNSAEEENAKILSSLKSQLASVGAEFERFIFKQGHEPSKALSGIAEFMSNTLALANTPLASTGLTAMLGLMTALSVKMAITAVQMKKVGQGSGFIAQSGRRIQQAWSGAAITLEKSVGLFQRQQGFTNFTGGAPLSGRQTFPGKVVAGLGSLRRGASRRRRSGDRRALAMQRLLARSTSKLTGLNRLALGVDIARTRAMATMNLVMVRTLTTMRGMIVAVRSLAFTVGLPLIAIGAAIWAINKAFEAVGRSSEGARRQMAGFNEEAQRAQSAAGAAGQAGQFFRTVQKALPSSDPAKRLEQAEGATDVARSLGLKATPDLEASLKVLKETGDEVQFLTDLEEAYAQSISRQRGERVKAREAILEESTALKAELERLDGKWFANQNTVKELESQLAETSKRVFEMAAGAEEFSESLREAFAAERAAETSATRARGDVFRALPSSSETQRIQNELMALKAEDAFANKRQRQLTAELTVKDQIKRQQEEVVEGLQKERDLQEDNLVAMNERIRSRGSVFAGTYDERIKEAEAQKKKVQAIEKEITAATSGDPDRTGINERLAAVAKGREDRSVQRGELEGRQGFAKEIDAASRSSTLVKAEINSAGVGDQVTSLLRQRAAARSVIERERSKAGAQGEQALNSQVRLQSAQAALERISLDLATQRFDLRRQELQTLEDINRESRESLVGAGPEGLVRRVAALRAVSGGLDQGPGFFALGADLQRELARISPNANPRLQSIRRQKALLGGNVAPNLPALQAPGASSGAVFNSSAALALEIQSTSEVVGTLRTGLSALAVEVSLVTEKMASMTGGTPAPSGQLGGNGGANGL